MQSPLTKFVVCIDNTEYPVALEQFKIYRLLPDDDAAQDGDLRVIDESGEAYLYPADYFVPIDLPDDSANVMRNAFFPTDNTMS